MDKVAVIMDQMEGSYNAEILPTREMMHPNCKMYTRELFIPEGTLILGNEHTEWSLNVLVIGKILLANDPNEDYVELSAPQIFETGPGSQKLVKALTNCIFMTVTNTEDGETAEDVMSRTIKQSTKEILCHQDG